MPWNQVGQTNIAPASAAPLANITAVNQQFIVFFPGYVANAVASFGTIYWLAGAGPTPVPFYQVRPADVWYNGFYYFPQNATANGSINFRVRSTFPTNLLQVRLYRFDP